MLWFPIIDLKLQGTICHVWSNICFKTLAWLLSTVKRHMNCFGLFWFNYQGFWYFVPSQSCQIHKNTQNSLKFVRNHIKYVSVHHIWNLCWPLGLFTWCQLANLSWNFVTETSKQCPKTTRGRLCCEKLGCSHDIKSFAIGSFLDVVVVERANDYLC